MAQKDIKDTGLSYHDLKHCAMEFLLEKRVITLQDLEDHLFNKFHNAWEEGAFDNLKGRKRKRWENLVDWVKANLTKEGFTDKIEFGDTLYLYHIPMRGDIYKEGSFLMYREHRLTMIALAKRVDAA
jgi:hypothetical protein